MNLPLRPPLIVHHMAAHDGRYPPNSLEAVRACLEANADFIEIDVTALAQDDYLLVHDPVLESETTGNGEVSACLLTDAQELWLTDAQRQATPYHPALLSEIVAAFADYPTGSRLQIDFKNVIPFADDEPLHRLTYLIAPLGERVIVSSGADWQLRRLHKIAPWLELGFDVHFYIDWRSPDETIDPRIPPYRQGAYGYWDDHPLATQRYYTMADYLAERCAALATLIPTATTFYIDHKLIAQSLADGFNWAADLHTYNIKLDAWTMDSTNPVALANLPLLLEAGVDQITTNTPQAVRERLSTI